MKTLHCEGAAVKKGEDEVLLLECLVRSLVIGKLVCGGNNSEKQRNNDEAEEEDEEEL